MSIASANGRLGIVRLAAAVAATVALAGCGGDPTPASEPSPGATTQPGASAATNEVFQFESEELAGNLLGASDEITVGVLLPSAYFASEEPLPVVYFLPGYTADNVAADMPEILGDALAASEPMIVVTITGVNELGGGWYTDSPATGNWEQAIVTEIVPHIDANYRTIQSADARGIAGHSMGGYGAFTIGMRHADVFGSVFAMSPAIAGESGVGVPGLFGSETRARTVIESIDVLEGLEGEELLAAMADSAATYEFSYGTSFVPSTEPPYLRYPYTFVDGKIVRDDEVWAEWEAGFGGLDAEVAAGREGLLTLTAVGLDCGSNDEYQWIYEGCGFLDEQLTVAGVPHVYTVHDGTHVSRFSERIVEMMVPFFAEVFAG